MIVFRTSLALVLASTALTACINDDSDSTTIPLSGKEVVMQAAGDCTLQLDCGDGTLVRCSGSNNQCFSGPGSSTITCNGIATSCSIVTPPARECQFRGIWFQSGFVYGHSNGSTTVFCSSKVNGMCTAGPFGGSSCVASGDCYATCVDGTWQHL